jgi:DNA-binding CsgD family transcriptional regulator
LGALRYAVLRQLGSAHEDSPLPEPEPLVEPLTEREIAVLAAPPTRRTSEGIAQDFYVSVNTVTSHLAYLYQKLGVTNRREAVRREAPGHCAKRLRAARSDRMSNATETVKLDDELWTWQHVACYLHRARNAVFTLVNEAGFPAPISIAGDVVPLACRRASARATWALPRRPPR